MHSGRRLSHGGSAEWAMVVVDRSMSTPYSRDLKCRFTIIARVERRAINTEEAGFYLGQALLDC